ncbi:MAG: 30S ribosomal protein S20 [Patescibacteria group bacterium]
MPIIRAAKKALRSGAKKRVFNVRRIRAAKTVVKDLRALATLGKAKEAREKLSAAYKALDKAVKRGVMKKNAAARTKSRLSKLVKNSAK